jgi:hypothetical protein
MGGFSGGAPGGKTSLRDAKVLWRRREWPQAQLITASAIGLEKKMYRLQDPPPGTSQDAVDKLWDTFEKPLPTAVARTAMRQESSSDHNTLKGYVAAAGVRHPDFAEAVNRWRAEFGMPAVTGDQVQVDRVALLGRGLKLMEGFRWRIVHRPEFGPRFVINDRGWTYIGHQDRSGRGLWIPLSCDVGMTAWLQKGEAGGFEHLTLWPGCAHWLNTATWIEAPRFVVGHPDDGDLMEKLARIDDVAPRLERFGPYRDRRMQGFFSDFL